MIVVWNECPADDDNKYLKYLPTELLDKDRKSRGEGLSRNINPFWLLFFKLTLIDVYFLQLGQLVFITSVFCLA